MSVRKIVVLVYLFIVAAKVFASPLRPKTLEAELSDVRVVLSEHKDNALTTAVTQGNDNSSALALVQDVLAGLLSLGSICDPIEARRVYLEVQGITVNREPMSSPVGSVPVPSSGEVTSGKVQPPAEKMGDVGLGPSSGGPATGNVSVVPVPSSGETTSGKVQPPAEKTGSVGLGPSSGGPATGNVSAVSVSSSGKHTSGKAHPPAEKTGNVGLGSSAGGLATVHVSGSGKGSSGKSGAYDSGNASSQKVKIPPLLAEDVATGSLSWSLKAEVESEGFSTVNHGGHLINKEVLGPVAVQEFLTT